MDTKNLQTFKKLATLLFLLIVNITLVSQSYYLTFDTLETKDYTLPEQVIDDKGPQYVEIQFNFPGAKVTEKTVKDIAYNYSYIQPANANLLFTNL